MTFVSCQDPKLTYEGLRFRRNRPGKKIPNLIWRSLAGFSHLLTLHFKRDARVSKENLDLDPLALDFLTLRGHLAVAGTLN